MIEIPEDVTKYLVKDEIVDKRFDLNQQTVFTSAKRLFIKRGSTVKDFSYSHVSDVELKIERKWWLFYAGVAIIVGSFLIRLFDTPSWADNFPASRLMYSYGVPWFYYILGLILGIVGYLSKTLSIKLSVAGLSEDQILSGNKVTLNSLFQLLNERRFQLTSDIPMKSKSTPKP